MSRRRSRKPKLPGYPVKTTIESLSHDGRGVAHIEGKAIFVDGALPGEPISFMYTGKTRKYDEGKVCELYEASPVRVEPKCASFEICGGCSLQHISPEHQIQMKQQTLLDNFERIGKVEADRVLEPLTGPVWGYRNKARLGVKRVHKKHKTLVGFREQRSSYLADIPRCEVLHPSVGERLEELAELIEGLQSREKLPQIEVAIGDETTVLVIRNLVDLPEEDSEKLIAYAKKTGLHLQLQPKGPDSVTPLWPEQSQLFYRLSDYDLTMNFLPIDFTQVNPAINQPMVRQALSLLELQDSDEVLDLFCGLGNFTLPIAKTAGRVTGVEGDEGLVQRARDNARLNGINNVEYHAVDLTQDPSDQTWMNQQYNKVLIDPPRSGACEMMPYVAKLNPERIVYVACHPGTLARDAGILVNEFGYHLQAAGVMDMFPHTTHVESMALFTRDKPKGKK